MVAVKRKIAMKGPSRNRPTISDRNKAIGNRSALEDIIEEERTRLMKARSILGCVALAMEGNDEGSCELDFPDIIELAGSLINESINRLDSVNLRPFLGPSPAKAR